MHGGLWEGPREQRSQSRIRFDDGLLDHVAEIRQARREQHLVADALLPVTHDGHGIALRQDEHIVFGALVTRLRGVRVVVPLRQAGQIFATGSIG